MMKTDAENTPPDALTAWRKVFFSKAKRTNSMAHPDVTVEIGNERFLATARLLTGNERTQAWAKAVAVFPAYGEYQKKTIRELPVFLLERGANA